MDSDKDNFTYQGACLADLFDEKHGEPWRKPSPIKGVNLITIVSLYT